MKIEEYKIRIPDSALEDLAGRIRHTKWAPNLQESGWSLGTNKAYLSALVDHWATKFDWRKQEQALNNVPQYRCEIEGVAVHFFHVKGKGTHTRPLILTHGWPDSFMRYWKVIPLLTDPARYGGSADDAFDVVVPSLPGVGFSLITTPRGFNNAQVADLWAKLMTELGYDRFGAAGGDMGSGVTRYMALHYPERLTGIHLTDVGIIRAILTADDRLLSPEEKQYKADAQQWIAREGGYMAVQSTKPQTLAYALSDSPVGLAAWIVEKFYAWSDCREGFDSKYSADDLLNNIMLYWLNNSIAPSARMYYENMHTLPPMGRIDTPTALAIFAEDILPPPRKWVEENLNLVHWSEIPRGGHFTAMEEPQLFTEDIRKFFRNLQ